MAIAVIDTIAGAPIPLPRPLQALVRSAVERWSSGARSQHDLPASLLAEAIDADRLRVAYQPIVELPTHRPIAVEALVRLDAPPHPALEGAPAVIAVAERSGLIAALGTAVLVQACTQLAAWHRDERLRGLQIHVNVSPHQLRDDRFVEVVERTLAVTGLPASAVVLEVTETAAFEGDGVAEATLTTLTSAGLEISIDDFGTGFASLELLASTPARSIKLDRSFIASVGDVSEAPRGRALMVQAAIGLGHALGLRVVAEGVESETQVRTLAAWGCSFAQGYALGRPAWPETLDLTADRPLTSSSEPQRPTHRPLSVPATDVALALALLLAARQPAVDDDRADAMRAAAILAETLELDRHEADITLVLASMVDPPARLRDLLQPHAATLPAVEVANATAAAPRLARDQLDGLAAAARHLADARRSGVTLDAALGVLDASVDESLRRRLESWWHDRRPSPSPAEEFPGLERRLRHRDEAGRRLRSLTTLLQSIGRASSLEDLLEVTADEARAALGSATLSISQIERDRGRLRVVVNVGELASWEQRRPVDEHYELASYPLAAQRLIDRAVHIVVTEDPHGDPEEIALLRSLDKGSSIAAPLVIDGTTWGEVYATTAVGEPPFTMADAPFVTAISNVIGVAIQRNEQVEQLTRLAEEDPLTRLANRRRLEQQLRALLEERPRGTPVGLLMLDVDGLKDVNDDLGHAEGDALLVRVGDVLSRAALTRPGALAARLAGDEFCILLPGGGDEIEALVERIRDRLADGPPPQARVSAGFAVVRAGEADLSELLRRADAAQYRAKRTGAHVASIGPDDDLPTTPASPSDRRTPRRRRSSESGDDVGGATRTALTRWSSVLDANSIVVRLEALGDAAVAMLDLNRWVLSEVPPGSSTMHIRSVHARRRIPHVTSFIPLDQQVFEVQDYPSTREALRTGRGFHVHVDDASADPDERRLLTEFGVQYVVLVAETDSDGRGWVLEFFGDEESHAVTDAVALIEALSARTLGREAPCPSAGA